MINSDVLTEGLNNLSNKLYPANAKKSVWTLEIKKLFAGLFQEAPGTYIYASGLEENYNTEDVKFLYDLVVLQETKTLKESNMLVTKCVLALQSQWGTREQVINDFQKLLLSNANYKVILFADDTVFNVDAVLSYMERSIQRYTSANGVFFLIYFSCATQEFNVRKIGEAEEAPTLVFVH